jgi:hypothetical protein
MTHHLIRSAVIGLWLAGPAVAADLPAPTPVIASDADLERQANAALAAVPDLDRLNLIVSVVGRTAVVGGAVPDEATRDRVSATLQKVAGLTDVKVICWVPIREDPLVAKVGERLAAPARPWPPPLAVPSVLAAPAKPDRRPAAVVTAQRAAPPVVGFKLLLDPVASTGPPRPVVPPPYPTIPAPAVPTAPADPLADAVAGLKAKSPRFAGLTVTAADGVATISGRADDPAAAWDLAAAVRAAPGVTRVVVGDVR